MDSENKVIVWVAAFAAVVILGFQGCGVVVERERGATNRESVNHCEATRREALKSADAVTRAFAAANPCRF